MGFGKRDDFVRNVITTTLDPTLPSPGVQKVITNYPDTAFAEKGLFPLLSPRLSPDGTRTALGSKQIWAARRNMNLPPQFTSVTSTDEGTRAVPDTAALMEFFFPCAINSSITVLASDSEGDPLTYQASFLKSWMTWNPTTRTLSGRPPDAPCAEQVYVKFWVTTPSGGTDSFIALVAVGAPLEGAAALGDPLAGAGASAEPARDETQARDGPNASRGLFQVTAPLIPGATARLTVFDLSGRRVATVRGRGGEQLVWDRRDDAGNPVSTGVYLYRLEAGRYRQEGKFLVIR